MSPMQFIVNQGNAETRHQIIEELGVFKQATPEEKPKPTRTNKRITAEKLEQVAVMRNQGKSWFKISDELGHNPSSLSHAFKTRYLRH